MNFTKTALLFASSSLAIACGGGGGSGGGNTTEPIMPSNLTWVRVSIGADYAANNGVTGEGSIVTVLDTGIDWNHEAFANANIAGNYAASRQGYGDSDGHGTAMASTIVGVYSDNTVFGVAPSTSILNVRAFRAGGFSDHDLATGIRYAVTQGTDIISMSLGLEYSAYIPRYTLTQLARSEDVQAISYATRRGVIVVMATGNEYESNSGFPAYFAGSDMYNGLGIAVTALDENDQIADFANRCKTVDSTYCIAAPGVNVFEATLGGGFDYGRGTSQATAIVSGSFALIKEYFPQLTSEEIVQIVLMTTDDLGATGVDNVYGSGKINLERALQPIGTTSLANTQSSAEFAQSQIQTSSAMASSFSNVAAFSDIPVFDNFNRPYALNLEDVEYLKAANQDALADEERYMITADFSTEIISQSLSFAVGYGDLSDWNAQQDTLINVNTSAESNPFLGVAAFDIVGQIARSDTQSATAISYFGNSDTDEDNSLIMISHNQQFGRFQIDAGLSRLSENGQALGLEVSSGFGEIASAKTDSVHIGMGWENYKYGFNARANFSNTNVDMKTAGLITGFDDISSRSLAVGAHVNNVALNGDRIDFGVAQSLAVTAGNAQLDSTAIAAGANSVVSLMPSGQETIYEIGYNAPITENLALQLNASYLTEANNVESAEDESNIGLRFEYTF